MATRKQQKEQTRRHLIEVAISTFSEKGIYATSTMAIAEAAGVSHGTLFSHFKTREILLTEIINVVAKNVVQTLHELICSNASMRKVLEGHLASLARHENIYRVLISEIALLPEEISHSLLSIQSDISHHISRAAEKEMNIGNIRQSPLPMLFNTWIGLIHHYLINKKYFSPDKPVLKSKGDSLINHFMSLISVDKNEKGN